MLVCIYYSPYTCSRTGGDGACNGGSYACDTNDLSDDIDSGYVCTGSGTQTIGSTTYYSSSGYTSCTGTGSPYTCQRVQTRYSCDGSGASSGPSEGTVTYNIAYHFPGIRITVL